MPFSRWVRNHYNVLVLDDAKLAFILVTKVAHNAIRASLEKAYPSIRLVRSHELEATAPQYEALALVRHPASRLVSCYENKVRQLAQWCPKTPLDRFGFSQDMSFPEFIEQVCRIPDEASDRHFRSQYDVLSRFWFTHLGKYEAIDSEWKHIQDLYEQKTGTRPDPLPVINASNRAKADRSYFTPELKAQVLERYYQDFEQFAYRFDDLE